MTAARLEQMGTHILSGQARHVKTGQRLPDDIVVVCAVRTPICRARRGGFKDTTAEYLLSTALKAVIDRTRIDPAIVEDIIVGNALPPGGGEVLARMAMLHAGFPVETTTATVNRQCSSGLQAVVQIADAISSGSIDVGIGAGVESMTQFYGPPTQAVPDKFNDEMMQNDTVADCLLPMGITSENVSKKFGVDRLKQDTFAVESHRRASKAQKEGLFDNEICPVTVKIASPDGDEKAVVICKDDGIRHDSNIAALQKLRPAFDENGFTTAGNASQVSDGAAAVLLMKRSRAERMRLPILGKYVCSAVAGVPPNIMGIGPSVALPKALQKAGISIADLDIIELNEAFASQCVYCINKLGLDPKKVNPKGGAIALGHPLGCTGARQVSTLLYELTRTGGKIGAISMCIGTGMGMCGIFESQ